jgi:hypothetical protein
MGSSAVYVPHIIIPFFSIIMTENNIPVCRVLPRAPHGEQCQLLCIFCSFACNEYNSPVCWVLQSCRTMWGVQCGYQDFEEIIEFFCGSEFWFPSAFTRAWDRQSLKVRSSGCIKTTNNSPSPHFARPDVIDPWTPGIMGRALFNFCNIQRPTNGAV